MRKKVQNKIKKERERDTHFNLSKGRVRQDKERRDNEEKSPEKVVEALRNTLLPCRKAYNFS